jgi:hypothetical protein
MNTRPEDKTEDEIEFMATIIFISAHSERTHNSLNAKIPELAEILGFNIGPWEGGTVVQEIKSAFDGYRNELNTCDQLKLLDAVYQRFSRVKHENSTEDNQVNEIDTDIQAASIKMLKQLYLEIASQILKSLKTTKEAEEDINTEKSIEVMNNHVYLKQSLIHCKINPGISESENKIDEAAEKVTIMLKDADKFDYKPSQKALLIERGALSQNSVFNRLPKDVRNIIEKNLAEVSKLKNKK